MENETRPGYQFGGWYVDKELTRRINPSGKLPGKIELYPKWIPVVYPIIYELDEGMNSPHNPRSFTIESGILKLYPAACPDRQFAGWFLDGRRVEYLSEGMTGPVRLKGKFQPFSKVRFDTMGGSRLMDVSTNPEGRIDNPPVPVRTGYEFAGWYLDEELLHAWSPEMKFLDSGTLYADWELRVYDIEYDLDGGEFTQLGTVSYTCITPTFFLPSARKEGCRFLGWFDPRGNQHLMVRKGTIGSMVLSARWLSDPQLKIPVEAHQPA